MKLRIKLPSFSLTTLLLGVYLFSTFFYSNFIYRQFQDNLAQNQVRICIAKEDLGEGIKINSDHLASAIVMREHLSSQMFFWKDRSQLFGLITTSSVKKNELFIYNSLNFRRQYGTCGPISTVKGGYRVVSFPIKNGKTSSGKYQPGDVVNLQIKYKKYKNSQWIETAITLDKLSILALDQNTGRFGTPPTTNFENATFLISPLECEVLIYLKEIKKAEFFFIP